jgi:hypothetical protein
MKPLFTTKELIKDAFHFFHDEILDGTYGFASRKLYRNHPYLGFVLEGSNEEYDPQKTLSLNSYGLRAPENIDNDCYRICIIGGSVAFGSYAPRNDRTIPGFLENKLNEMGGLKGKKVKVYNCGHGGHNITQHFILTHHVLLDKYKPNLVLCLAGYNDFSIMKKGLLPGESLVNEFSKVIKYMQTGSFRQILVHVFIKTLLVRYKYLNLYYEKIVLQKRKILNKFRSTKKNDLRALVNLPSTKYDLDFHVQTYVSTNEKIRAMLNGLGVLYMSAIQPALGYGKKPLCEKEQYIMNMSDSSTNEKSRMLNEFYDSLRIKMGEKSNTEKYKFVDCTNIFDGVAGQIYCDPAHIGDIGNELIADKLMKEISSVCSLFN